MMTAGGNYHGAVPAGLPLDPAPLPLMLRRGMGILHTHLDTVLAIFGMHRESRSGPWLGLGLQLPQWVTAFFETTGKTISV